MNGLNISSVSLLSYSPGLFNIFFNRIPEQIPLVRFACISHILVVIVIIVIVIVFLIAIIGEIIRVEILFVRPEWHQKSIPLLVRQEFVVKANQLFSDSIRLPITSSKSSSDRSSYRKSNRCFLDGTGRWFPPPIFSRRFDTVERAGLLENCNGGACRLYT
jgi:hypothetical protein